MANENDKVAPQTLEEWLDSEEFDAAYDEGAEPSHRATWNAALRTRPALDDAMVERIAIEAVSAVAGVDFDMCDADDLHESVMTAIREALKGGA